jgi:transposase
MESPSKRRKEVVMNTTQPVPEDTKHEQILHLAFELSAEKWKLAFTDGRHPSHKARIITIEAKDMSRLEEEIEKARKRFQLAPDCHVRSCYEAGRDGFWLHRYLTSIGVENFVIDPASIEVNRRKRRAKTDRIDARLLLKQLVRHSSGERENIRVVRVPSVEAEDIRYLSRELEFLKREKKRHTNRIRSLLCLHGVDLQVNRSFLKRLEGVRTWDGKPLPPHITTCIKREYARLEQVWSQIWELEKERNELVEDDQFPYADMIRLLTGLRGVGLIVAWILVTEFFGWRDFKNRREVGGASGMTGTPWDSGAKDREQGISKAGNKRVRVVMNQLAWLWLRYQPDSKSSRWFMEKWGSGSKRQRKNGITALARRLLVELWHLAEHGVIPEGAVWIESNS